MVVSGYLHEDQCNLMLTGWGRTKPFQGCSVYWRFLRGQLWLPCGMYVCRFRTWTVNFLAGFTRTCDAHHRHRCFFLFFLFPGLVAGWLNCNFNPWKGPQPCLIVWSMLMTISSKYILPFVVSSDMPCLFVCLFCFNLPSGWFQTLTVLYPSMFVFCFNMLLTVGS